MTDRYVLIEGGVVIGSALWDGKSDWAPEQGIQAVPSETADVGWTYAGGKFTAPATPAAPEPTDGELAAAIAARRYHAETSGTTVNGMPLDTGRDSQALVTGAALAAVLDPAYSCQWKTASGAGFITLDAQQIIALAGAMRAHVQACFDREAALLAALEAGTYTDEQLEQGWPE